MSGAGRRSLLGTLAGLPLLGTSATPATWTATSTRLLRGAVTPPDVYIPVTPTDVYVSIDIDAAAAPTGPITDCRPHEQAREKSSPSRPVNRAGRCVVDRGRCVDDGGWLVSRYIDDLRISRYNLDDFFLHYDDLFFICFQIAHGLRLLAKTLDGVHDIFLLVDHGITQ